MRHKHKKILEVSTGIQKSETMLRNMLTSLILGGKIETTMKKSKALKAFADAFFSRVIKLSSHKDSKTGKREAERFVKSTLYSKKAGKKCVGELLPFFQKQNRTTSFVANYKMGFRKGDGAEKVVVTFLEA